MKRLSQLTVYGDDEPIRALKSQLPSLRVMSMGTLKSCLASYAGAGWAATSHRSAATPAAYPGEIRPLLVGMAG